MIPLRNVRGGGEESGQRLPMARMHPLLVLFRLRPDPNNDSPLNTDAAQLWGDQEKYREVCLQKYRDGGGKA